jgi:hypothetical protein
MSDWWSRRLSDPNPPKTREVSLPPTSPLIRFPAAVTPQHQQQPQFQQTSQRVLDDSRAPTDNLGMGDAIRLWKGGEAHRKEGHLSCPSCGSKNVFTRVGRGGTMINGSSPAPRCFECGWNGMYDQGEQSNWAV